MNASTTSPAAATKTHVPSLWEWVTATITIVLAAFGVALLFYYLMPDHLKTVTTIVQPGKTGTFIPLGISVAASGSAGLFVFLVVVMQFSVGHYFSVNHKLARLYGNDLPPKGE